MKTASVRVELAAQIIEGDTPAIVSWVLRGAQLDAIELGRGGHGLSSGLRQAREPDQVEEQFCADDTVLKQKE